MDVKIAAAHAALLSEETGTVRKEHGGRIRVALIYPNTYYVGMSSLGFQRVYELINAIPWAVAERAFLPDRALAKRYADSGEPLRTLESNTPVNEFDLVAFSTSFEMDYPHIIQILRASRLEPLASRRGPKDPLVVGGGVAMWINPEPVAELFDAVLLGEAEGLIEEVLEALRDGASLSELPSRIEGVYVPAYYTPDPVTGRPRPNRLGAPPAVVRRTAPAGQDLAVQSLYTPNTAFSGLHLVETGRGCIRGCRFCAAGFIYRPPRDFDSARIAQAAARAPEGTRVGLVAASVADHPDIRGVLGRLQESESAFALASLRADRLDGEMSGYIARSGIKTVTIAPEAATERMRRVINKGLDEAAVARAISNLAERGVVNFKLYMQIGLPTEAPEDVEAIPAFALRVREFALSKARALGYMGEITLSVNPFIPKPWTPFQWAAQEPRELLQTKVEGIRAALSGVGNLRLDAEDVEDSYLQCLFSRGDRRVLKAVFAMADGAKNLRQVRRQVDFDPDAFVTAQWDENADLPWDIVDHGIKKKFLVWDWHKALAERSTRVCDTAICKACGVC